MKKIQKVAMVGALILLVAVLVPIGCSVWEHRDNSGGDGKMALPNYYTGSYTGVRSVYFELSVTTTNQLGNLSYIDPLPPSWLNYRVTSSGAFSPKTVVFYGTPPDAGSFSYTYRFLDINQTGPNYVVHIDLTITPIQYTVSVSSGGDGTVSGSGTYNEGTWVTIRATPNAHYYLQKWLYNNSTDLSRSWNIYSNFS